MRWKTVPQMSGRNRKRSDADVWTAECIRWLETLTMRNAIIVWLQCLLVVIVRQTGMSAPDRVKIGTPEQRPL